MVDTIHLLPPSHGPQSDPLLFGVACALEQMFPVVEIERAGFPTSATDTKPSEDADAA